MVGFFEAFCRVRCKFPARSAGRIAQAITLVGAVGVAVIALTVGIGVAAVDVIVVVVYAEYAVAAICLVQCAASDTALVASGVGVAEGVLFKKSMLVALAVEALCVFRCLDYWIGRLSLRIMSLYIPDETHPYQ